MPLIGEKLFSEIEDVLGRNLFDKCPLIKDERNALFDSFASVCEWVEIFYLWRPNLPDEGDNHILELAIAGGAEAVTHNLRDFERGELRFPNIEVLTPAAFLKKSK